MSRALLENLNGGNDGPLRQWLDNFQGEPRIAWYPSAGDDLRDLMYLSENYRTTDPSELNEPHAPDIFIHTDYYPWRGDALFDSTVLYSDDRTKIICTSLERLPDCRLTLDKDIVAFARGSKMTGRALFTQISIQSDRLGLITAPLIYVFCENAAFCAERLLPMKSQITHVIKVRYGGGCGGGGHSSGVWLKKVLGRLNCEIFVTDQHGRCQSGDVRVYERFPEIGMGDPPAHLTQIRRVPSASWSGHGDVSWMQVQGSDRRSQLTLF